jgi:hypothetical protein
MILCYQLFFYYHRSLRRHQKFSRKGRKEIAATLRLYRRVFASLRSLREIKKLNRITER